MFVRKRTDILPRLRAANNVGKSHEHDAKMLSMLDNTHYLELREYEVGLKIMLQKYHNIQGVAKLAKQL
ncbi:MAG: hypothetical protein QXO86_05550 [Nitrososphaerota archaeon]